MSHDIWERSRVLESYRPGLLLHLRKFAKPLLAYFIISQMEKLPALLDLCAQPCVCVCVCVYSGDRKETPEKCAPLCAV